MRQMRASHTGGKVYQDPFKLVYEHQLITGPGPLNLLTRLCYWLCSALDHSMHDNGTPNNRCTCWARPWQNKRWLRTRLSTGTYRCFSVCHDQEWVMFRILILGKLARKTSNCMCHQSLHALTVLKLVSVWTLDRSLACMQMRHRGTCIELVAVWFVTWHCSYEFPIPILGDCSMIAKNSQSLDKSRWFYLHLIWNL